MKLGQIFDSHRNALNAMRLIMASEVIFCHSFVLPGHVLPPAPLLQLMSDVGVDGFFALSGFLITASWLNHPRVRDYLIARALRILPAFYVCLVVTAFVFAPIGVAIQGGPAGQLLRSSAPFDFVAANSAVFITKLDVGGTPTGIPMSGYWNGNLWTLFFEVLCYLAVAALGIARLASRRWTSAAIVAVATLCVPFLQLLPPTPPGAINGYQVLTRFALMFAAGAVMYQWKHIIPARWSLVAVSVIIVLAASLLPDYRLVGALPLAYAVVVPGALIRNKHLRLPTDLSYGFYIYGFPVQQVLVISGLINLNPFAFAVISTIATLPLAALSWFVIEKPAMSLKSRLKKKWATAEAGRT
ncbi:acyltransferase family protein [Mycobacterium montefiorense]|uniref:Acyltransferase n=1 Tax=Mycobacterium montefiorense TaxID=154654 RepID=A0AA37PMQ6_9MYCO|nr:acyltransferase [Mycobacterium montefiorense]GBG36915.1 acyltransferase [Mycobacterium montefiorense]GKU37821.1 acyltransferase [Mycobacterium montefiorense]GKU42780.1 acyltransferase [Mycobacterium montefiorense]GKU46343.1 acyltransferase [Mycobacterium montefiorense]GKU51073.1 acyltransferase [Mycobacterium montefiorense]